MSTSYIGFLVSLAAVIIFTCASYVLSFDEIVLEGNVLLFPPPMRIYGQWKYLTYHCMLMQLVNAYLHFGAYFLRCFEKPRDIWFTCLAYPIGNMVVFSFWSVWILFGREYIFPSVMTGAHYPTWLNHSSHTVITPINILLAIFIHHKYYRNFGCAPGIYWASFIAFHYHLRAVGGLWVYRYLRHMNEFQAAVYFIATILGTYPVYKSGQWLTNKFHNSKTRPAIIDLEETRHQRTRLDPGCNV